MGKPFHSVAGQSTQLTMDGETFNIYLPPMSLGDIEQLSPTQETVVGFGPAGKAKLVEMFPGLQSLDAPDWPVATRPQVPNPLSQGEGEGYPMWADYLEQAVELRAKGEPFVLATVVACQPPQSARPGAKGIIRRDGLLTGWVGGGCVQPIVVREALKALADGQPRLLSLSSGSTGGNRNGVHEYAITCLSGGGLEIYLEPVFPRPELLIFGATPVAQTLARLGKLMDFAVCVVDPSATREHFPEADLLLNDLEVAPARISSQSYVVVATMGHGDEEALETAVGGDAAYVGLVASRRKGQALSQYLQHKGVAPERLQRVKYPAGLPLGGLSPAEIALSIMAEIVQLRQQQLERPVVQVEAVAAAGTPDLATATEAIDPICGMTVEVAGARYTLTHDGTVFYFCCARCKDTFERAAEQKKRRAD